MSKYIDQHVSIITEELRKLIWVTSWSVEADGTKPYTTLTARQDGPDGQAVRQIKVNLKTRHLVDANYIRQTIRQANNARSSPRH